MNDPYYEDEWYDDDRDVFYMSQEEFYMSQEEGEEWIAEWEAWNTERIYSLWGADGFADGDVQSDEDDEELEDEGGAQS